MSVASLDKPLGECLRLVIDHRGKTPKKLGGDWVAHGIPAISAKNVNGGRLVATEGMRYVTKDMYRRWMKEDVQRGDCLLVSEGATLGECMLWDEDYPIVLSQRIFCLRPNPDVLYPRYLYAYMTTPSFQAEVKGRATGSSVDGLRQGEVLKLNIALPPLEQQRKIGDALYSLNKKIELNQRMNGTLEALAQAVFKEWFVEKAEEGWKETSLAEQVEVAKGLSYKGSGLADAGRPMHNLNSIYEFGRYKYEGIKWYTGEFKERHLCKAGDVIVANTEQGFEHLLIGSAAIVPKRFGDEGLFTHHIYRVRPLPTSYLTNHFLYLLLSHPAVREQVQGYTNGTTVNSLAKEGLERPTFKLPPKALVEKFDAVVAPLFARQEANYEETQTLTALRDTLLPKLMRGEVGVKQRTIV